MPRLAGPHVPYQRGLSPSTSLSVCMAPPSNSPTSISSPATNSVLNSHSRAVTLSILLPFGVALYEGVGTYSRGVAIAPTPVAGRGSMDVGSPSELEIDVKDGSHCLIELVRTLV